MGSRSHLQREGYDGSGVVDGCGFLQLRSSAQLCNFSLTRRQAACGSSSVSAAAGTPARGRNCPQLSEAVVQLGKMPRALLDALRQDCPHCPQGMSLRRRPKAPS